MKNVILTLGVLLLAPSIASADTVSITCTYELMASNEGMTQPEDFVLRFLMDGETGKAYMMGNNGSTEVEMILNSGEAWTFVEMTDTGNVMTTTVTVSGDSVHSRNSVLFGELVPSQYYGTCVGP